jgi:hypothetical protein
MLTNSLYTRISARAHHRAIRIGFHVIWKFHTGYPLNTRMEGELIEVVACVMCGSLAVG